MTRWLLVLAPLLLWAQNPSAPAVDATLSANVDQMFAEWTKPGSPGAAVVIVKDGAVVYRRGFGYADLEQDVAITPATRFQVASVTKQFTAFAIVLLAQQGRLLLDDDVRKHIRELAGLKQEVTIRHLLHHTAGFRESRESFRLAGWREQDRRTLADHLWLARNIRELNFKPGERFLYSNMNYFLLAEIVSRVSGKPFRDFCRENIFEPLGMKNTLIYDDLDAPIQGRARSYRRVEGRLQEVPLNTVGEGSTGVVTTADDMAKWLLNFGTGQVGATAAIVQMQDQSVLNNGSKHSYTFGLFREDLRGLTAYGHAGADASYRAYVLHVPEQRFGVAVLSNTTLTNPNRLSHQIAELFLGAQMSVGETSVSAQDPGPLADYVGQYVMVPRYLVDVVLDGQKLFLQGTGRPKTELVPGGKDVFNTPTGRVVFTRDGGGQIRGYQMMGVEELDAEKLRPITVTAVQLSEYSGHYQCPELETTYRFAVHDGKLGVSQRRMGQASLRPISPDEFLATGWIEGRVRFTRDAAGKLDGFRLTSNRIKNLRFERATSPPRPPRKP